MLLDTCAAIWLMNGDPMTDTSRQAIRAARIRGHGVYVSPISAWEIATLVAKERIQLAYAPETWFERMLVLPGMRLAGLSPAVLIRSAFLPGKPPTDPADRIIAATAREFEFVVVTRDRPLLAYGRAGHLNVRAC
ncbi:MAG TPA: type II toxin-antitoxin system VapC family toxin [Alphaproteobacteria bacterium]